MKDFNVTLSRGMKFLSLTHPRFGRVEASSMMVTFSVWANLDRVIEIGGGGFKVHV